MVSLRSRVIASVLFLVVAAGCGSNGRSGIAATSKRRIEVAHGGWVELPRPPLTPRAQAVEVWTGREVLVMGGVNFVCPPNADCALPLHPPFVDGAALDPATETWKKIAPAPIAFSSASTAVVGNAVYLLVPDGAGIAFLRYSIADDAWTRLPLPAADASPYRLVAAGAVVIAFAFSDELGAKPDLAFDPAARTWNALPADPLSPGFDREMAWSGADLYLFDHELVPSPNSERPSITRAARLHIGSPRWERLPDSEILGTGPWLTDGSKLVSPVPGSADGGEVCNWGRSYPNGGVFDTATSTWSALPRPPTDAIAGAVGDAWIWRSTRT